LIRAIATVLLALALLVWSVATIVVRLGTSSVRAIAEDLEDAAAPRDLGYFTHIEQSLADGEIAGWCARDAVQSFATIRLSMLDASSRSGDPAAQAAALTSARATLRSGLRCFPRDGNLWLRLAMVEYARAGPSNDVQAMLKTSQALAPSEAWIMIPRISFAARLRDSKLPEVEEIMRSDVHNLAAYGRVPDIVELYVNADEGLRELFASGLDTLDAERVEAIERAIAARLRELEDAKLENAKQDAGRPAALP
jgi:hypothetical protein